MRGLATATSVLASSAAFSKPASIRSTSLNISALGASSAQATPSVHAKREQTVTVTVPPPVSTVANPVPDVAGLTYTCTQSRFPVDITYTPISKPTVTLNKPGGGNVVVTIEVPQATVIQREARADICEWRATSGPNRHAQRARTPGKPLGGYRLPFARR